MTHDFFSSKFNIAMHYRLFIKILKCCIAVCLLIYAIVHIVLFDFPLVVSEEIVVILKMLLTGVLFAASISGILLIADAVQYAVKRSQQMQYAVPVKKLAIAAVLLLILISAGKAQPIAAGTVKDNTTGLTAVYKKIKPGSILLTMNNEIIHHTDIPLGESFVLVNAGIKGFTVKNGKVSAGCALTIKNNKGEIMLQSDDLFNGNDIFSKDSISFLKCTVSTGTPMQWEEKYEVRVLFWDKYGSGKIDNKVFIRCIDIP